MAEPSKILDHFFEPVKAVAARIGFVSTHQSGPLLVRHGACSRIRKQIEQNVSRAEQKEVTARLFEKPLALGHGSMPERFDALDPKRLDNRLHRILIDSKQVHYANGNANVHFDR